MEIVMGCIEKLPHSCGSTDGLQTFYNEEKGTYTGYCFPCSTFVPKPYETGEEPEVTVKTQEDIFQEIQEVKALTYVNKTYRGIPPEVYKSYGCRIGFSEQTGKEFCIYFGYSKEGELTGWKARLIEEKSFFGVGDTKACEPFGYTRALKLRSKRLWITEGEFDAMALNHALVTDQANTNYARKAYPVISLPRGSGSMAACLKLIHKKISLKFKEIVLVMDDDDYGREAEKIAQKLLPNILRMDMPIGCKDPNEAVEKGMIKELVQLALWEAHRPPIKGVIQVLDILDKVLEDPVVGLSYPHGQLTEMTFGQRTGECIAIGGGVGTGKTTLAHEWAAWNIIEHSQVCSVYLLEEQNHATVRNIAGKIDSIPYHIPGVVFDRDRFMETARRLQGKLLLWESDGDQAARFDITEIISAIRFNTEEYGSKFHYLDNMTRVVDHLPMSEANEFINKYSSILEGLSVQLDIHIDVFSHLNNTGKVPHEQGGRVYASQFTGSRGMMRSFPMMMGFERNKHIEGECSTITDDGDVLEYELCGRSYISIIKNRKYGNEGRVKSLYNKETSRLLEEEWEGDSIE